MKPKDLDWVETSIGLLTMIDLTNLGYRRADSSYQPEPDIHNIEMVGSELWIKDKQ